MFNTSSLVILQRCWEPITASFHHHLHLHGASLLTAAGPPSMDASLLLLLHQTPTFLASMVPSLLLALFFSSSFLLPRFLWSLHYNRKSSAASVVVHDVECIRGEGDADLYYISDDDDGYSGKRDLIADVVLGGEVLLFLSGETVKEEDSLLRGQVTTEPPPCSEDSVVLLEENHSLSKSDNAYDSSTYASPVDDLQPAQNVHDEDVDQLTDIPIKETTSTFSTAPSDFHSPLYTPVVVDDVQDNGVDVHNEVIPTQDREKKVKIEFCATTGEAEKDFTDDQDEDKNLQQSDHNSLLQVNEENLTDTWTNGSTSKSSCEWRGSVSCNKFRDSETDGFFSSSSRRSSANWESYTVYRKYDEDMTFFTRISSQKLRETESLRSIKVQPRSISERIVYKMTGKKQQRKRRGTDPYQELEAAYVAQVCLAWEAINWNHDSFQRLVSNKRCKEDLGCPARVAQQFQQFQVLLQRFIENEPYEYGRRPEVYARMRISSPKLLQVPDFHGDDAKEDLCSRIPSSQFLGIMEDVIRTFMNFLKADKEKHWKVFIASITNTKSSCPDPNLYSFMRKAHHKKKTRLKDLQRSRNCSLKKKKLKPEEEMEILMGLIDLKVVSRVLRMPEISEQQLHWCEEKMSKVRFWNGRVQRDSSPLFFPAQ